MLFASIQDKNTLHIAHVGKPTRRVQPITDIPSRDTGDIVLAVNSVLVPQMRQGVAELFRAVQRNSCTTMQVFHMLREGDRAIVNVGSTHPWDQLPAELLAKMAGAVTCDVAGKRFKGETYVGAPTHGKPWSVR